MWFLKEWNEGEGLASSACGIPVGGGRLLETPLMVSPHCFCCALTWWGGLVGRWTCTALLSWSTISSGPGLSWLFQITMGWVPHQKVVIPALGLTKKGRVNVFPKRSIFAKWWKTNSALLHSFAEFCGLSPKRKDVFWVGLVSFFSKLKITIGIKSHHLWSSFTAKIASQHWLIVLSQVLVFVCSRNNTYHCASLGWAQTERPFSNTSLHHAFWNQ